LSKWKKVLHKKIVAAGLHFFCFVLFVRAEYFRDNNHQISKLTINKCWHVYRVAQCMSIASFSAALVASFKIRTEGEE
jgi:hypothetical protein